MREVTERRNRDLMADYWQEHDAAESALRAAPQASALRLDDGHIINRLADKYYLTTDVVRRIVNQGKKARATQMHLAK